MVWQTQALLISELEGRKEIFLKKKIRSSNIFNTKILTFIALLIMVAVVVGRKCPSVSSYLNTWSLVGGCLGRIRNCVLLKKSVSLSAGSEVSEDPGRLQCALGLLLVDQDGSPEMLL